MRVEPKPVEAEQEIKTSPARTVLVAAVVLFLGFRLGLSTVGVILALIFMIFLHELGHYITAKAAGMKVTEFFIGFGPRIWSFQRGETEYGFKAIPAGAYVRIIGMSNLETDVAPEDEERTYRAKPYWRRLSVGLAGSTMHFLVAFVLILSLFAWLGLEDRRTDEWVVGEPSGPALEAGIEPGDRILSLDGQSFDSFYAMSDRIRELPGETVELVIERGGEQQALAVELADEHPQDPGVERGFLGISTSGERVTYGPIESVGRSIVELRDTMWLSVVGLGDLFSPDGLSRYMDNVTGAGSQSADQPQDVEGRLLSPVGAVRVADQAASNGIADLVEFLFLINVFVGVFNLVPLLPLDGGHVAIATYEKIRSMLQGGRPYQADVAKLLPVTYAVFLVLVVIGVTALYVDLVDPIKFQ